MEYRGQPHGGSRLRNGIVVLDMPVIAMPLADSALDRCDLAEARAAQALWQRTSLDQRLAILRRLRHAIAQHGERLASTVPVAVPGSLSRTLADTLASEILPLADACRFLEKEARRILAPRKLSRRARPFFLRHVEGIVERVPLGVVLVLGPANYPLFLPGVQTLQAHAAGNAVLWKPAATGRAAAHALVDLLTEIGLPPHLVTVLDTDVSSGQAAIAQGVDKVVLTGHVRTGRSVLRSLAETATPAVMELSGCDAAFILPGADLALAARAIAFGLRLNGSATCMAPRRLFVAASEAARFEGLLRAQMREASAIPLPLHAANELHSLFEDARSKGAQITPPPTLSHGLAPTLITNATSTMRIMQTDIFAPVLSMMSCFDTAAMLVAHRTCPYALTASVFGPEPDARRFASELRVGAIVTNDVIVPTADPRLPFGGRGLSGYGVTRGAEGLLEMTAVRTLAMQRRADTRAYQQTGPEHLPFFSAWLQFVHGSSWPQRFRALRSLAKAARGIPRPPRTDNT